VATACIPSLNNDLSLQKRILLIHNTECIGPRTQGQKRTLAAYCNKRLKKTVTLGFPRPIPTLAMRASFSHALIFSRSAVAQ